MTKNARHRNPDPRRGKTSSPILADSAGPPRLRIRWLVEMNISSGAADEVPQWSEVQTGVLIFLRP